MIYKSPPPPLPSKYCHRRHLLLPQRPQPVFILIIIIVDNLITTIVITMIVVTIITTAMIHLAQHPKQVSPSEQSQGVIVPALAKVNQRFKQLEDGDQSQLILRRRGT